VARSNRPAGGRTRMATATRAAAAALVLTGVAGCTGSATTTTAAATAPAPVAGVPAPGSEPGLVAVVERLTPSVVTVNAGPGLGSGVVYRPDVVITNQHVVADARSVTIDFADGTSSPGTVLATDAVTDLAVIRTERAGLPVPEYRVELPRQGETVLAIGSPLGFENTVTAGIVSALNRQIPGSAAQSQALVDLIQVDAAISPGNSGGALLDAAGRVIGINEAYIPPETGAVSLGFAIPASTAVNVADQLLADGTATHAFLGVSLGQLTPQIRQSLGVEVDAGALVLGVQPGGPAGAAGVQRSDIIVGLGGTRVESVEDVLGALRSAQPGQQVPLVVVRSGQRQEFPVTVAGTTG
jgi:serine protease Do